MLTQQSGKRKLATSPPRTPLLKQLQIFDFLEALWRPQKISVIHCEGHKKGDSEIAKGINWQMPPGRQTKILKLVVAQSLRELSSLLYPFPLYPMLKKNGLGQHIKGFNFSLQDDLI